MPAFVQMRSAATAASTTAQKAVADTAKKARAVEQMSQCAAMRAEGISSLPGCFVINRNGVFGHARHNT